MVLMSYELAGLVAGPSSFSMSGVSSVAIDEGPYLQAFQRLVTGFSAKLSADAIQNVRVVCLQHKKGCILAHAPDIT